MGLRSKVLWAVDIHTQTRVDGVIAHAAEAGCDTVCLRTTSRCLPDAIGRLHRHGLKVYAWRWPAAKPVSGTPPPHYYALDEADFVVDALIPAGLDGYVVDPESDPPRGRVDDWNREGLAPLAREFCRRITAAAPAGFIFATTSGCVYPGRCRKIPWAEFAAASTILLPQSYWRMETDNGVASINGGTPAAAIERGLAAWAPVAAGRPLVPMAGEIAHVTRDELAAYGARLAALGIDTGHFYADAPAVDDTTLRAIRAL